MSSRDVDRLPATVGDRATTSAPPPGAPAGPASLTPGRVGRAPRVASALCGAALVAGIIASYVLLGLTPSLLAHHAVVLEALSGNIASIVIGGAQARVGDDPLWLVTVAPLAGVVLYDVFYWWAGRLWGDRLLVLYAGRSQRRMRWLRRGESLVRRRGGWALAVAYYLPIPNVVIEVLCGLSGMSLLRFVVFDVIGTLLWEALLLGLGWGLGQRGVTIAHEVNHYALYVTVALVVLVVVVAKIRESTGAGRTVADRSGTAAAAQTSGKPVRHRF